MTVSLLDIYSGWLQDVAQRAGDLKYSIENAVLSYTQQLKNFSDQQYLIDLQKQTISTLQEVLTYEKYKTLCASDKQTARGLYGKALFLQDYRVGVPVFLPSSKALSTRKGGKVYELRRLGF